MHGGFYAFPSLTPVATDMRLPKNGPRWLSRSNTPDPCKSEPLRYPVSIAFESNMPHGTVDLDRGGFFPGQPHCGRTARRGPPQTIISDCERSEIVAQMCRTLMPRSGILVHRFRDNVSEIRGDESRAMVHSLRFFFHDRGDKLGERAL